jgi:hypothetical protein
LSLEVTYIRLFHHHRTMTIAIHTTANNV